MNCETIRERLDESTDGFENALASPEAAGHLAECAKCREEVKAARLLLRGLDALPGEIAPPRDLWAGIDSRLDERRPAVVAGFPAPRAASPVASKKLAAWSRMRPALLAASVVILVGAAFGIARFMRGPSPEIARGSAGAGREDAVLSGESGPGVEADRSSPARAEPSGETGTQIVGRPNPGGDMASGPSPAVPGGSGPIAEVAHAKSSPGLGSAELAFREARETLRTAIYTRRDRFSSETIATVEQNLKLIENAVLEIEGAIEKDPGNRELRKMLAATRHREVALLQQMTRSASLRQR